MPNDNVVLVAIKLNVRVLKVLNKLPLNEPSKLPLPGPGDFWIRLIVSVPARALGEALKPAAVIEPKFAVAGLSAPKSKSAPPPALYVKVPAPNVAAFDELMLKTPVVVKVTIGLAKAGISKSHSAYIPFFILLKNLLYSCSRGVTSHPVYA